MAESEVPVQLNRAARVRYGGPGVARPKACLGEDILGLRVFTIERHSLESGFPGLTHEWGEVLDRAVVPLHDQRTGCRRRPSCIGGTQLIDDHEVTQIALPQEQTHPTGRARACGRLSQPASNRRCPMNLPSAIPPGQAKSPPPVWVTNWFSMSNFANLSKILMKPVRRSRW
jgi:hypothetical protein